MADELERDTLTVAAEVETVSPCERRIKLNVPFDEVEKQFRATYEEMKNTVRIPGFRPGKAPRQVVEMRLGSAFRERALADIRVRALGQAVREHKLRPVSAPQFEKISYQRGQPFTFEAVLEVVPDVKLPEYKGVKIERTDPLPVTDEDVTDELNRLRDNFAELIQVTDRPLRDGDFAVITYEEEADGKTEKFERRLVEVAPDSPLPGFGEKVRGMRPGEKRDFQIKFPDDYGDKEAAGKLVNYRLELVEIRTRVLPEADDEFAKKLRAQSLEELKKAITKRLTDDRERRAERHEIQQIMLYLLKNTDVEVPRSLLAEGARSRVRSKVDAGLRAGISATELRERREEIVKDAAGETYGELKLQILLAKIAEAEGIGVSPEEIEAQIAGIAARTNKSKEEVRKQLTDQGLLDDLEYDIVERKVVSFLHNSAVKE